ncbi:hypothetical protein ACVR0S_09480 [Streptococcus dentapri]|uniref:WXG100 family type VII secretion target n=1 Tax=Streptococcus dentapri TaxID=573564 RepID=A0ABV8D1C7_9STRE
MSSVMNDNINSSGGEWGSSKDTITYEDGNIGTVQSAISTALTALTDMETFITEAKGYDVTWKGKAKDAYEDLMTFIVKYRKEFKGALDDLKDTVDGLEKLLNDIPSANVLKEIDNA